MKKFVRGTGIVFAVLILVIVVLTVVARIVITPERIRDAVLPIAREALQREVELGDIDVSLFRGITLQNLNVREREGTESFIAADRVVLRYQLWPLLFKRVVVDEVRLEAPRIRVERLADGHFSFSDLLPKDPATAEAPAAAPEPEATSAIDLLVSEVTILDGQVVFLDRQVKPTAPLEYKLTSLNVTASEISLEKDFPFTVQASINGSSLDISGKVNVGSKRGQATVRLGDLELTVFSPYFADQLPGRLGSLKLSLDLSAEGGADSIVSSGRIDLKQIDLVLDSLKDVPLRGANAALDYMIKVDLAQSRLTIDDAKVSFNGIPLLLAGTVENFATAPSVDLTAKLVDLDLRQTFAALPSELVADVKGLDPAGTINLSARLAGPVDKGVELLQSAEVRLSGVQANVGGLRPALSGQLDLLRDSLESSDLALVAGDNRAAIDLKASNLYGKPIQISSRVTSERFELDPLLQNKTTSGAETSVKQAESAAPAEVGPFDLPLHAEGSVQIKKTVYKGMTVDNFDLHYRLEKNLLTVDRLTGKVAGGSLDQTARVDLGKKGLDYSTRLLFKDVQAEPLVNAFAPKAAGTVFGTLRVNADFSGRGTLPETIKRNLSGNGAIEIADGKLTGSGLMQGLASFVNLEELRTINFRTASGAFTVNNGKVNLNSDFSGTDARLSPQGIVGLDGELDLALDLRLSPALTGKLDRRGNVAQFFSDAEGWGQVPLKVKGTIGAPRFAFDSSVVKGAVKEKARQEIEKKLQEKVFDKLAPKEGEEGKQPAKQILDEGLKKLFGR